MKQDLAAAEAVKASMESTPEHRHAFAIVSVLSSAYMIASEWSLHI
jgi:hypothetical protein